MPGTGSNFFSFFWGRGEVLNFKVNFILDTCKEKPAYLQLDTVHDFGLPLGCWDLSPAIGEVTMFTENVKLPSTIGLGLRDLRVGGKCDNLHGGQGDLSAVTLGTGIEGQRGLILLLLEMGRGKGHQVAPFLLPCRVSRDNDTAVPIEHTQGGACSAAMALATPRLGCRASETTK